MTKKRIKRKSAADHPAIVPEALIRQAAAFTAPRGRLEMGGLLIGHVDAAGNSVAVTGIFPEQLQESSGYCEFDGMWTALAAAACDHANQIGDEGTPDIRVIGWIHTHPDIGIFLSGIDVATYRALRDATPDRRFMAVVVDPLREENGVFLTERKPNTHKPAEGEVVLCESLVARYDAMLNRLEQIRGFRGLSSLPCILPGPLRHQRLLQGARDDVSIELERGFFAAKREIHALQGSMVKLDEQITYLSSLRDTCRRLEKSQQRIESEMKDSNGRLAIVENHQNTSDETHRRSRNLLLRLIRYLRRSTPDA